MKNFKQILFFLTLIAGTAQAQEVINLKLEHLPNSDIWSSKFVIQENTYELKLIHGEDSSTVELTNGSKQTKFYVPWYFIELVMPKKIELSDVDGNGLTDLKIVVANNGSGIAASLQFYIFLLQTSEHQFCYLGCLTDGDLTFKDLNSDGLTEVISRSPDYLNEERTVTYNAFNIKGCSFLNVDSQFNYPKMNFRYSGDEVTLSAEQLKKKSKPTPDLMAN
jgi:hypothetical protein